MIPGANLFRAATRIIATSTIQYLKANGRTQNSARQFIASFDAPEPLQASVQAVSRNKYQQLGLDFQKRYIKIFAAQDIIDLGRDTSGDRIIFNGRLYELNSETDWFVVDGWASCLAADVGPAP